MAQLKAGVIGCGGLGKVHTQSLKQLDDIEMVAYCDVIADKAEALLAEYGGKYATADPDKILTDRSIDVIYVCTQHDSHANLCIEALQAGKAVMVEKPLALTVNDCLRIGAAVTRTKGMLMTAFKMRYYDMLLKARQLIEEPIIIVMQIMDNRWPNQHWANDPVKGGGNVIGQGCHACDIIRFVARGEPLSVYAAGGNYYQATGVVDNISATFRFNNGCAVSWVEGDAATPSLPSKFFMEIFAENKSITLDKRLTHLIYQEAGQSPQEYTGSETGFLEENRAFIEAILNGKPAPIDHKDGLMATLMPLQAIASLHSGQSEPVLSVFNESVQ